ncbi:hypothetical protein CD187_12040 [Citrobacter youngae]|nr:hypothetical protein CD187_12040 [Citrobacter youngae]
MVGQTHPALAFARLVESWSPGIFSKVDRWRETESSAPWQFMTFRQCRAWLSNWLKHNPAPEEGFLCPVIMKRFPPHIVYMTLAAWRTGKTLLHCDESLFRVLGETRQTDALPGDMLRHLPFWGFWLDFPADTVFAEGQGALMGAFFSLADHDSQTDALLALTIAQDPLSREHIPMGMEYLPLTSPVSAAISQQQEGVRGFWHAVLPVLFWLCSANGEWGSPSGQPPDASESISASSPRINPCKFLPVSGPVRRSGRHREYRKPVPQETAPPRPIGAFAPMSERPTGKTTGRADPLRGRRKVCC